MDRDQLRRYKDLGMADLLWVSQLVALRKRKGFTQQEVADHMGVEQSTVSKIENSNSGRRRISADQLHRYARAIGAYTGHVVVDADDSRGYHLLKSEIERHTHALLWDEDAPATSRSAYTVGDTLPHNDQCRSTTRISDGWTHGASDEEAPRGVRLVTSRATKDRELR